MRFILAEDLLLVEGAELLMAEGGETLMEPTAASSEDKGGGVMVDGGFVQDKEVFLLFV